MVVVFLSACRMFVTSVSLICHFTSGIPPPAIEKLVGRGPFMKFTSARTVTSFPV